MLQIVHDLAPHAQLAFATAYSTELEFAQQHRTARRTGRRRRRRRQRDRRRRRLLHRALLPGRPGRRGDPEGDGSGRHLPDRGGQRQPVRQARNAKSPPGKPREFRPIVCPTAIDSAARTRRRRLHELQPEWRRRSDLRHHRGSRRTADHRPAVGRTLVRGRNRPRRLPAVEADHIIAPNQLGNYKSGEGAVAEADRSSQLGERIGEIALEVQLVIARCSGICNPEASAPATPRLKFALLEDGRRRQRHRVSGIGRRRHRRPDDLRPRRLGRRDHPRRGQVHRIGERAERTGALLLARTR